MSVIKNNPIMKGASGMLGNVVVYREQHGQLIMANKPAKRALLTLAQENAKERFLEAVQYAKAQMANPVAKAEYATGINDRRISAYAVAVSDYLKAPEVKSIDAKGYTGAAGDLISIKAFDDFKVLSVHVEIRNAADLILEQGEAVVTPFSPLLWIYTAQTPNGALVGTKIVAIATDRAGNTGTNQIVL
jgi:hypothetical protein